MRQIILLSFCCSILTHLAHAEIIAAPSKLDKRTRTVAYDAMQVYKIKGYYGYLTRIEFAPDEKDITYAMGDEEAWAAVTLNNNLLVKPTKPRPATNMTVLTSKRTYNFVLTAESMPDAATIGESVPDADDMQFLLRFTYPREERAADAQRRQAENRAYAEKQRKEREEMERKLREYQVSAALQGANNSVLNTDYFGCGAEEALPVAAYDNHKFTFLKFAPGQDIPAIFATDTFGDESLLNYSVEEDWIVLQRVGKEFTLRNGKYVGCLINANRITDRTDSGTVSNKVQRKLIKLKDS